jgi:hypothetical protein
MKKNFIDSYGYAPFKNDIILNDYLPEVKPVRGMFVDDLSIPIEQPIDYNPIPPFIDVPAPPIEQPIVQPIERPKFVSPIFIDDMPPLVEMPIELPIETPIEQPILQPAPKFYSPLFINDMPPPLQPIVESPAAQPIIKSPDDVKTILKTDATEAQSSAVNTGTTIFNIRKIF